MNNKGTLRHAGNHPAIQKLRQYFREYSEQSGTMLDFARHLDLSYNTLTRYLRGECKPRKSTIHKWAVAFGIDDAEMTTAPVEYIPYPFDHLSKPKQGGQYLSKKSVRQKYRIGLLEDYDSLVREGLAEYNTEVVKILEKNRI